MALIKCPECGHKVSDTAETCPSCGCPISQIVYERKIKAKRESINNSPVKDDSWTSQFKVKNNRKIAYLIVLPLLLPGVALLVMSPFINSIALEILGYSLLGTACLLAIIHGIYSKMSYVHIQTIEKSTILFEKKGRDVRLYVDGKLMTKGSNNDILIGYLTSGTKFTAQNIFGECKVVVHNFEEFIEKPKTSSKNIVNNYVTNNITNVKAKQPERSDMEKKLIKNAKIDALASIDPNDTEKSKEQINIVKELDDLD